MLTFDPRSEIARAWAAGFYEGEGNIFGGVYQRRTRPGRERVILLAVHQVDPEPLLRFVSVIGRGKVMGPYANRGNPKAQGQYRVQFNTRPAVGEVVEMLLPLLSDRRQEQIRDALATYDAYPLRDRHKTHCKHGHEFTSENTAYYRGYRACRICNRERARQWQVRKRQAVPT